MEQIKILTSILEGGNVPPGYDEKAIQKLTKSFRKLENPKVVSLYPVRCVTHEDSVYCLYACPLKGEEIDKTTLQAVKAEVDTLEIGHIRYDSVQSSGDGYYIIDPDSGYHILENEEDRDAVMEISDRFDGIVLFTRMFTSSKKVAKLDCHYAVIGLKKLPNEYQIENIPNNAIGEAPTGLKFSCFDNIQGNGIQKLDNIEEETNAPAIEKYKSATKVLSVIITAAVLIWYIFLR